MMFLRKMETIVTNFMGVIDVFFELAPRET